MLRSDEIRKRLHGRAPEETLPESAYNAPANEAVDEALLAAASAAAEGGHPLVIDATFLSLALRSELRRRVTEAGSRFVGLWLEAPTCLLEKRIRNRRGDASDATVAVLHRAESLNPGPGDWRPLPAREMAETLTAARRILGI